MAAERRLAMAITMRSESERNSFNNSHRHPAHNQTFEWFLADISSTFVNAPSASLDGRIEDALRRLASFLDIDRAAFGEVAEDGTTVLTHFFVAPGIPSYPRTVTDHQLPWWSERVRRGEVLAFSRLPDELPPEAVGERAHCVKDEIKSHLTIPIKVDGSVMCILTFVSIRSHLPWPIDLVRRLQLLGEVFANAVARKRAGDTLRERERSLLESKSRLRTLTAKLLTAQEEERRRVAREMHDDWSQRLALLSISIAQVEARLGDSAEVRPLVAEIQRNVVELANDVHDLSRQLHPSILDDLGLVEALRAECALVSRREGLLVYYEPTRAQMSLPFDKALCLYRVAQEALRNVVKHAAASHVRLVLVAEEDTVLLRVSDDGVGFDGRLQRHAPGLGLSSMTERVRIVNGRLTVESSPGRGATIEARVPMGEAG